MRWEKKHNKRKRQVELRATVGKMCQVLIVVGLDGYDHKYYARVPENHWRTSTSGKNVHFSMNGPISLSFAEWDEFMTEVQAVVAEARDTLRKEEFDGKA